MTFIYLLNGLYLNTSTWTLNCKILKYNFLLVQIVKRRHLYIKVVIDVYVYMWSLPCFFPGEMGHY